MRILIADDHQIFRDGLRALLLSLPDAELVREATNGNEAVALAEALKPDIILMDVQMPEMNGIEATRLITKSNPDINILMLTMFEDDHSVFAAMRAGARGYVLKGVKHDEMVRAIEAVASGEAIVVAVLSAAALFWICCIDVVVVRHGDALERRGWLLWPLLVFGQGFAMLLGESGHAFLYFQF